MKKLISAILLATLTAGLFALPNLLKKEQFGASAIENLYVDLSWEDVTIKETYDVTSIEVEVYCNHKNYAPEVSVSDSSLYIDSARKRTGFFTTPTGLSCTVIVYVPQKKDFDEVSLEVSSGEINVEKILSAKSKISLTSSSGDIDSEKGLFADKVIVKCSSGEMELYNIDADDFYAESTSGDIEIKKFTGGTGSVKATSGEIKIEDFASEYAEFRSSSGSISVKKLDCDYFDASSTSGGLLLDLKNAPLATSSVECTSGDIDIYLPMRAKFSAEASSNSGTFRDKFNNNRMTPRDNYVMDYNGGGSLIKLRTTSGDITLDY